ncbi:MAG: prepilin-type N-terminal cleavage/methylation domain-containing protein [Nitrospira sp.]|nr:prepilin-type N-terminal cleavage/methylation domain-containing protein [Nitrospira sp.]
MTAHLNNDGFSLIEVMVAMMISGIALMGTLGAVEITSRYAQQGGLSNKALELAQARLEVKRSVRWHSLLEDDLDHDGTPDTFMLDDGQGADATAGDGIYTAMCERDGVTVVWTIEGEPQRPLHATGIVAIRAVASYSGLRGQRREVHVATIRANPSYIGQR